MLFSRFLFSLNLIFFPMCFFLYAAPGAASNLSKSWSLHDRKMRIQVHPVDRFGKDLDSIPLNQVIQLRVDIIAVDHLPINDLALFKFDAQMPAHRHGMVTKAKISSTGSQRYLIEGVKLHMPGMWQLVFDLKAASDVIQVAIPLNL